MLACLCDPDRLILVQTVRRNDVDCIDVGIILDGIETFIAVTVFLWYSVFLLPVFDFCGSATDHTNKLRPLAVFHCVSDPCSITAKAHDRHAQNPSLIR